MDSALAIALAVNLITDARREVAVRCVWCLEKQDPAGAWSVHRIAGGGECMTCPYVGRDTVLVVRPKEIA